MKGHLFLTLVATFANLTYANYIPQEFLGLPVRNNELSSPNTLMDNIFGDLINTPEILLKKQNLINSGILSIDDSYKISSIHNYYKANKLNLPDKDDVSDIISNKVLYSGIVSFAHLPVQKCFENFDDEIDIAVVGAPFDSGVSYSPGTRFGPNGVRQGSRRLFGGISPIRGNSKNSKLYKLPIYNTGIKLVDCGDIPMIPFDSRIALDQLYRGQNAIHKHNSTSKSFNFNKARIVTLGGDHTISLMNIKSAFETFANDDDDGLAIIHFDSHIDTWDPKVLGGAITKYASLNHGTFLHYAAEAGYVSKNHSVHVGIRAPYISEHDEIHDRECGFKTITSKDVDTLTPRGVGKKIKQIVGNRPVYLTFDLDTFDAGMINSGTLEAGGLNSREIMTILDELEGIKLVGCDITEVSTPPNSIGNDITGLLAAQVIDELIGLMVVTEV
jgi:agmatinase